MRHDLHPPTAEEVLAQGPVGAAGGVAAAAGARRRLSATMITPVL